MVSSSEAAGEDAEGTDNRDITTQRVAATLAAWGVARAQVTHAETVSRACRTALYLVGISAGQHVVPRNRNGARCHGRYGKVKRWLNLAPSSSRGHRLHA